MIAAMAAAAIFVSCDGGTIVSAAPAVWQHGRDGWDQHHGDAAPVPSADAPGVVRAACTPAPVSNAPPRAPGTTRTGGSSRDRSLLWSAVEDGGTTHFTARLWSGEHYDTVVDIGGPHA